MPKRVGRPIFAGRASLSTRGDATLPENEVGLPWRVVIAPPAEKPNVGRARRVAMSDLRQLLEGFGYTDGATYSANR